MFRQYFAICQPRRRLGSFGTLQAAQVLALLVATNSLVMAQPAPQVREYPAPEYYISFRLIEQGDFVKGVQAFRAASRNGIRTPDGPWVDAICYHAMIGECYFQMGDLTNALEQFTNSVRLQIAHRNWMLRVEFPPTVEPRLGAQLPAIGWGATSRRTAPGRFPDRYPILQGRLDNQNVIRQGGVVSLPEFYLINAHEVVRCAALAIRRRGEILGKTSQNDPLFDQLLGILTARPAPPNHWSQAWIDALIGMTYSVTGRGPEAISELTKSLQIGGQFDHPLTAAALLQLGRLAFQQGQYDSAAKLFFEATISGAWFDQTDLVEEAFRWGTMTHLVTGPKGTLPALDPALAWARQERSSFLEASLLTQQAHIAAELQENKAAAGLIEQARREMNRTEMVKAGVGSRLNYVAALTAFQSGNLSEGESAWAAVVAYQIQRGASLRLFEIGLVDARALSGSVTPRVANDLYADVLREPTIHDWATNPVETLSVVIAPNLSAYEHWLSVARERGEHERVVEIADRIRRLRFFSTLPIGGRLLALTWVLDAAKEALPERAALVRQDLLTRYPRYAEAARQSVQLREQLSKLPLVPEDAATIKQQQQLFTELAAVSQLQELMLRAIALRREAADFVCPPALDFKHTQSQLAPNQAILGFLLTSQSQLYGFLIRKDNYVNWRIEGANKFGKDLTELLRRMGQLDRNSPVDLAVLQTEEWKPFAADLWNKLTDNLKPDALQGVEELILVPDRWLWYVPFEALSNDAGAASLIARFPTRYSPTVSLALPDGRPANLLPDLTLVASRALPKSDAAAANETANALRKTLGQVTRLNSALPAPSNLVSSICRRLVVLDDVDPFQGRGPYDWSPLQLDKDKAGSTLSTWLALPWGAPDLVALPNYHTMAETQLKRSASGDELFLNACGLMASGTRTILFSRWKTGGQTTLDLTREFVQETPYSSASAAWQRSVQLIREKELDIAREPRVKGVATDGSIRTSHPFFWAGYLVIDRGAIPRREAPTR